MQANITNILNELNRQEFMKALLSKGKVYLVGGIVRDSMMNKESKDIDLLVTNIPIKQIISILTPFGKINLVGDSFGVLKFVPDSMELDEPIDIAIPRIETCIGTGHKDFNVIANHDIPIEQDLKRRDFTINAIAVRMDGLVIDPFNGVSDLNNKVIKMVDTVAFTDDPLRMLRAVQFASRLKFYIDCLTMLSIQEKANTIKNISPERILIELDKIYYKGDISIGINLLVETGLYKNIFGFTPNYPKVIKEGTRDDFYYTILNWFPDKSAAYVELLRGDIGTALCLKAIQIGIEESTESNVENRMVAFKMYKISKSSFKSNLLTDKMNIATYELSTGLFPLTLKHLAINGDDLIKKGQKGKEVGDNLMFALKSVYNETVENNKEDLLNLFC